MTSPVSSRLIRLKATIEKELTDLNRLKLEKKDLGPGPIHPRTLGSMLHDFYTGSERIFQTIAEELDGGLPTGEEWHRALLDQMTLDLAGIRPPVLDDTLRERLDEYLRFRHVFRHIYGFQLQRERCEPLADQLGDVLDALSRQLNTFCTFLNTLAEGCSE